MDSNSAPATAPAWLTTEPVGVTPVLVNPDEEKFSFLITRERERGAVVLTFSEDRVLVNGLYLDLGDSGLIDYCSMIDDCYPKGVQSSDLGVTTSSAPFTHDTRPVVHNHGLGHICYQTPCPYPHEEAAR